MLSLKLGNFLAIEKLAIAVKGKKKSKIFSLRSNIFNTMLIGGYVNEKDEVTF